MFSKFIYFVNSLRYEEAIEVLEEDLLTCSDSWPLLLNKAVVLAQLNRMDEAGKILKNLKDRDHSNPQCLQALGDAFYCEGSYQEAIEVYKRNVVRYPKYYLAYATLGMAQLVLGDFAEGIKNYEYRVFLPPELKTSDRPKWRGEDLSGKILLVLGEQGYGDTFQFIRFIECLKASFLDIKIVLAIPFDCFDLFEHLKVDLVNRESSFPKHDFFIDIVSLLFVFQRDLNNIPPPITIHSTSLRPEKKRVGIVWKGSLMHRRDRQRSLNIDQFIPLFERQGFQFVSLQKDVTSKEKALLDAYGVLQPELPNWRHTVRELEVCERLVCCDTAIAHLSASMGVPTCILIHYSPDWRWMLKREDSPWYRSVKLFRQEMINSWREPVQQIVKILSM